MAIYINSDSRPKRHIYYNSPEMDTVTYEGVVVHRKWATPPSSIDVVRIYGRNFNLYLRYLSLYSNPDLLNVYNVYNPTTGDVLARWYGVTYRATELTLELSTTNYRLAASNPSQEKGVVLGAVNDVRDIDEIYIENGPRGFSYGKASSVSNVTAIMRVQKTPSTIIATEELSRAISFSPQWYGAADARGLPFFEFEQGDYAMYHDGSSIVIQKSGNISLDLRYDGGDHIID